MSLLIYNLVAVPLPVSDPVVLPGFFQWFTLAILAGYCLLLYLFRPEIRELCAVSFSWRAFPAYLDEKTGINNTFIYTVALFGLISVGAVTLRTAMQFSPDGNIAGVIGLSPWLLALAGSGALAVIGVWRYLTLVLAGRLTMEETFTLRLRYSQTVVFVFMWVVATPVFLLWALSGGISSVVLAFVAGCVVIAVMGMGMVRSIQLFIERKISILYWIVYLCGVEIFPVSLIVFLFVRN